jgi:3-oxoacyl-[acyl-carrier-protein] synthase III
MKTPDMKTNAEIKAIEYYFPDKKLSNDELALLYPGWSAEKIFDKTGINQRSIAAENECASDLAVAASRLLFERHNINPESIDYIILCTQSPDYFLPTTACLVQNQLGIPTKSGAIDVNQGCSGFVYSLGLAKGLIASEQAKNVLLITAETYSKHINPMDKSVRTIFGDAAAATLVTAGDNPKSIHGFVYGTDGTGAENLIVSTGGMRQARTPETAIPESDDSGNSRSQDDLYMNGPEIFSFTLRAVPEAFQAILERSGTGVDEIDFFVFHQANKFMLDHIRKRLKVPESKFFVSMDDCGNTVSSTIPIALRRLQAEGRLVAGAKVMIMGFGVGYSWAGCVLTWGGI